MKPVCDHKSYCLNDSAALYLGQNLHISYAPNRNNNSFMPSGFASIKGHWLGLCSYTNTANGDSALCNIPTYTHAWRTPAQADPGFVCGVVTDAPPTPICSPNPTPMPTAPRTPAPTPNPTPMPTAPRTPAPTERRTTPNPTPSQTPAPTPNPTA